MILINNAKNFLSSRFENLSKNANKPTYEELEERIQKLEATARSHQAIGILDGATVLYQHIFDKIFDSIFVVDAFSGNFIDCNEIAADRLGYTKEEILKLKVDDINYSKVHQDIQNRFKMHVNGENLIFKIIHQHKNGHQMLAEMSTTLFSINGMELFLAFARYIPGAEKSGLSLDEGTLEEQESVEVGTKMPDLLKICSSCKRIEEDKKGWQPLESYFKKKFGMDFSHGICSECAERLYPEVINKIRSDC